jgi:hypothetical protein
MPTALHHHREGAHLLQYDKSGLSPMGDARSNHPRLPHLRHIKKDDISCTRCTTSNQAWTKLETPFASQAIAHILNVHYQLATLKKANLSIVDYYHKFQTLINALAAVNEPLSDLEK